MVSCQLHGPAVFIPDREVRHSLTKRLGGSQSQFGRFGEESQPLPGIKLKFLSFPKRKWEVSTVCGLFYDVVFQTVQCLSEDDW
jgi:hypothetical protein